jgi:hypothetical protein
MAFSGRILVSPKKETNATGYTSSLYPQLPFVEIQDQKNLPALICSGYNDSFFYANLKNLFFTNPLVLNNNAPVLRTKAKYENFILCYCLDHLFLFE